MCRGGPARQDRSIGSVPTQGGNNIMRVVARVIIATGVVGLIGSALAADLTEAEIKDLLVGKTIEHRSRSRVSSTIHSHGMSPCSRASLSRRYTRCISLTAIDGIRLAVNSLYPMPRPVIGCASLAAARIASMRSRERRAFPRPFLEPVSNTRQSWSRYLGGVDRSRLAKRGEHARHVHEPRAGERAWNDAVADQFAEYAAVDIENFGHAGLAGE